MRHSIVNPTWTDTEFKSIVIVLDYHPTYIPWHMLRISCWLLQHSDFMVAHPDYSMILYTKSPPLLVGWFIPNGGD